MFKKKQQNQSKGNQLVQIFMNHCATIIQANFKAYQQRKYYKKFIPVYRRLKQLLYANFIGWKTRKVFKLTIIKSKIAEIKQHSSQEKTLQMRIAKRDLSDEVPRMLKNGTWLYYFLRQNKIPLNQQKSHLGNKIESKNQTKINLKDSLSLIPKKSQSKCKNKQNQLKKTFRNQNIAKYDHKVKDNEKQKKDEITKKLDNLVTYNKIEHKSLSIQIQIEPDFIQIGSNLCETPSYVNSEPKQFCFHTKPRFQSSLVRKNSKNGIEQQQSFRSIKISNHSQRKGGIHMTLSKKLVSTIESNQNIGQFVLKEQNETAQLNIKTHETYSLLEQKLLHTDTSETNKSKAVSILSVKVNSQESVQSSLKLKKQELEKRKIEHEKRIRQFKNHSKKQSSR